DRRAAGAVQAHHRRAHRAHLRQAPDQLARAACRLVQPAFIITNAGVTAANILPSYAAAGNEPVCVARSSVLFRRVAPCLCAESSLRSGLLTPFADRGGPMVQNNVVQNNTQEAADQDEQLDARLAELLRMMHREHLALQEVTPSS